MDGLISFVVQYSYRYSYYVFVIIICYVDDINIGLIIKDDNVNGICYFSVQVFCIKLVVIVVYQCDFVFQFSIVYSSVIVLSSCFIIVVIYEYCISGDYSICQLCIEVVCIKGVIFYQFSWGVYINYLCIDYSNSYEQGKDCSCKNFYRSNFDY